MVAVGNVVRMELMWVKLEKNAYLPIYMVSEGALSVIFLRQLYQMWQ